MAQHTSTSTSQSVHTQQMWCVVCLVQRNIRGVAHGQGGAKKGMKGREGGREDSGSNVGFSQTVTVNVNSLMIYVRFSRIVISNTSAQIMTLQPHEHHTEMPKRLVLLTTQGLES